MKKLAIPLLLMSSLLLPVSQAAEVEVTWENPKDYTDVKPANESRKSFRKRTLSELDEYFSELAQALPADQKLLVTVTDVDLAGQVWPASFVGLGNSGSDVRLIKRLYIPRMTFSYQLVDADGNELQGAQVNLKDMSFQERGIGRMRHDSLRYEKHMLKSWFKDEFPALVAKN